MILCFGNNAYGQLGIGYNSRISTKRYEPVEFNIPESSSESRSTTVNTSRKEREDILDIQLGSQFSAVVNKNGNFYVCGSINGTIYPTLREINIQVSL